MKKVILDCDPGHDDAFAILLANRHLDVLGITTVGGNNKLDKVTQNALKVLEVTGKTDTPVYAGHAGPLVCELVTAPMFHGETGLDGPVLPEPTAQVQEQHAVDFIVETVMSVPDLTLIATGPLTNIAAAIQREPAVAEQVAEISIMGGSVTFGNWTPAAEFNIFVDPEAAYTVFNSGAHVKMCGINLTRQAFATKKEVEKLREIENQTAKMCVGLLEYFIDSCSKAALINGANLHDACAVAWLIDSSLIRAADMHVTVELKGEYTRGMTVCDYRHLRGPEKEKDLYRKPTMAFRGKDPNCEAALELDVDRFFDLLYRTVESYP